MTMRRLLCLNGQLNMSLLKKVLNYQKETDVYGANVFEAYYNANKLLSIFERGKKIHKIEVVH